MKQDDTISGTNDDLVGLGTDIPRSLRKKFKIEANKRDIPMSKATVQALELWLAATTGEAHAKPSEITSIGDKKTTSSELSNIVNLLTQLSASLQNQTEEIRALKLVISQKAAERGRNPSNKPTIPPTKRERAAASVLKRASGDK